MCVSLVYVHNTMYESNDTMYIHIHNTYNGDVCRNTAESNMEHIIGPSQTLNDSVLAGTGAIKWDSDAGDVESEELQWCKMESYKYTTEACMLGGT